MNCPKHKPLLFHKYNANNDVVIMPLNIVCPAVLFNFLFKIPTLTILYDVTLAVRKYYVALTLTLHGVTQTLTIL